MTFDDEAFERELFTLRAGVLAAPTLDLDDVMARAARSPVGSERFVRLVGWVSAAAVLFAVVHSTERGLPSVSATEEPDAESETAMCVASWGRSLFRFEDSACVDASRLVCEERASGRACFGGERVTFSAARP